MTEFLQFSFIALVAFGHVKLYLDDGVRAPLSPVKIMVRLSGTLPHDGVRAPLSPVKYNRIPYGIATFWDSGKFVKYIDLRQ